MSDIITIDAAKDVVEMIQKHIDDTGSGRAKVMSRRNLEGGPETWKIVADLVGVALPPVLAFIKDLLAAKKKKIKKIRVGDVEIENPSDKDIERLLAVRK